MGVILGVRSFILEGLSPKIRFRTCRSWRYKNAPDSEFWGRIICCWLILEVAECFSVYFWSRRVFVDHVLVLADFVSAYLESRRVLFSLCWVSHSSDSAYFWSRRFCFSCCCVSQSCCLAYFVYRRFVLVYFGSRIVVLSFCLVLAEC